MSTLEVVAAIVTGLVTIIGGSFALVRFTVGALPVLKGHLMRVEESIDGGGGRWRPS